jgi:hypothetical protein
MNIQDPEPPAVSYRDALPDDRPAGNSVDVLVKHDKMGAIKVELTPSPSKKPSSFTVTGVLEMLAVLPFMECMRVRAWGHSSGESGRMSLSLEGALSDDVTVVPGDIMEVWVVMEGTPAPLRE